MSQQTTFNPTSSAPFHRLLSYYSNRSQKPDNETVRLGDSLRGNLALGLDFPVALGVAIGRHLFLRNVSWLSLDIHIPRVGWKTTPLEGVKVDEKRDYSRAEFLNVVRQTKGWFGVLDALGLWALAADCRTGRISGEDVVGFQRGTLLHRVEERRKIGREQVLPLVRGGPIS
ncbi:uncharacterized protein K489DRAFT_374108 [Dissoconium aciculare CBS 342.82]|uniref:Uncharacterized protein n=1 Tax=Dissoconium aciculare CBS 342.82 TaxID=1314786 RepID=A0A6J3LSH9_9PEZI|nr:uncharacterized protein K489DRAFT_374108 [Dissoconium aciculare CBS 342.82]KAF1818755.1 hypothetical protein K489DRAFT_374108 [Dissoconium aciculare CBS 342.82]